jgi:hypothetical protein
VLSNRILVGKILPGKQFINDDYSGRMHRVILGYKSSLFERNLQRFK